MSFHIHSNNEQQRCLKNLALIYGNNYDQRENFYQELWQIYLELLKKGTITQNTPIALTKTILKRRLFDYIRSKKNNYSYKRNIPHWHLDIGYMIWDEQGKYYNELEAFLEPLYLENNITANIDCGDAFRILDQREKIVIWMLAIGYLQKEIADYFNLDRPTVSRIRKKAQAKMKKHLALKHYYKL